MHLPTENLALESVRLLVADDLLLEEKLLFRRPILQHLRVDVESILEEKCAILNGTNFATVLDDFQILGSIGRLII